MTNTYTWKIVALDAHPQQDGKENVIVTVHWVVDATDGTTTGRYAGATGVSYNPDTSFTPYANLTESQLIGWVKDALGDEGVANVEKDLDAQIDHHNNRPVSQALPWSN